MAGLLEVPLIVAYEDHNPETGAGLAIWRLDHGYRGRMARFGVKGYGLSGATEEILKKEKLDVDSMVEAISRTIK
jgi:transketolase C-terminal domain/subunit